MTGYINWDWWLVTSPLWGMFTIQVIAGIISAVLDIRREAQTKRDMKIINELASQELAKHNNQ
jgi:F0F1-type ATP synthase assembly protein I